MGDMAYTYYREANMKDAMDDVLERVKDLESALQEIKEAAQNNHPAKIDNWAMPGGQQKIRAKLNLLIKAMEGVKSST